MGVCLDIFIYLLSVNPKDPLDWLQSMISIVQLPSESCYCSPFCISDCLFEYELFTFYVVEGIVRVWLYFFAVFWDDLHQNLIRHNQTYLYILGLHYFHTVISAIMVRYVHAKCMKLWLLYIQEFCAHFYICLLNELDKGRLCVAMTELDPWDRTLIFVKSYLC